MEDKMMTEAILALNAGSSSIKFSLFDASIGKDTFPLLYQGGVDGIGSDPHFLVQDITGQRIVDEQLKAKATVLPGHREALEVLLDWIERLETEQTLIAVGHRVVHGGTLFSAPVLVDSQVINKLESLVPLAPLHQPHNLAAIRSIAAIKPDVPQVACFDTAFHRTQPPVAQTFALPYDLTDQGIKRYGFHGLSYEYIATVLPDYVDNKADGRVIVAHLGNGASMCAMQGRKSLATTMGFTALDGLPMGTRCGSIDPGVILYLLSELHMDAPGITDLLYHRSGLLGVSGQSSDMRELLTSNSPHSAEAIDLFVYHIQREAGSLAAALGGLDILVFTAGIGEHAAPIRAKVCQNLQWLGVQFDETANRSGGPKISSDNSAVSVWVIPTDEDLMIARHTSHLIYRTTPTNNS
jgi:acetate kinase